MKFINQKDSGRAFCLAVFGTGSEVGKSIVTTALCRFFVDKGVRVAPFKAQNMSNNSGVTPEGLEMGRAQIIQAEAARIPPHVDMNPILLKPTSEIGSQVVLLGEAIENSMANEYHDRKKRLFSEACAAIDRLRKKYELIIMEGAGSCAEVNLMRHDIVNFHMAEYADAPVILVADIHRGKQPRKNQTPGNGAQQIGANSQPDNLKKVMESGWGHETLLYAFCGIIIMLKILNLDNNYLIFNIKGIKMTDTIKLPIEDVLDLHTFHPRDIPDLLEDYLSECIRADIFSVRIIHGKGKGIQKKRVQNLLGAIPFVKSFKDAPPDAGGWGATLVELKRA